MQWSLNELSLILGLLTPSSWLVALWLSGFLAFVHVNTLSLLFYWSMALCVDLLPCLFPSSRLNYRLECGKEAGFPQATNYFGSFGLNFKCQNCFCVEWECIVGFLLLFWCWIQIVWGLEEKKKKKNHVCLLIRMCVVKQPILHVPLILTLH